MTATKLKLGIAALAVAGVATTFIMQHQTQARLLAENESLRQQLAQSRANNEAPATPVATAGGSNSLTDEQFNELLRLRGEVGVLRRQAKELESSFADARRAQERTPSPGPEPQLSAPLPEDYPRTADAATTRIFETWAQGDWNAFFTNFGEPGVPREVYDRIFSDPRKSNYLVGLEVLSVGTPTNGIGPNAWFVPYKIRLRDGSEKEFQLHVAQDPRSQRWYFKGGF